MIDEKKLINYLKSIRKEENDEWEKHDDEQSFGAMRVCDHIIDYINYQLINTESLELGDVISFTLNDGEEVEAMAVKETSKGMLFMMVDCLAKEYPMFNSLEDMTEDDFTYENSDLRKALNGEILARFPEEIRSRMVALDNGDMLRIPTEREIFGENVCGQEEFDTVKRFETMKKKRNRIAFQGKEGAWEWYWLMNRHKEYASHFAIVNTNGYAAYYTASHPFGVRPVFLLS